MAAGRGLELENADATAALGAALAQASAPPLAIHLEGALGTGKTTLARGFLRELGHAGHVKSPTYSLVESYDVAGGRVFHLDLYRLADPEEGAFLGLEELDREDVIVLVEWPERGGAWLRPADLTVRLSHAGSARNADIRAGSGRGRRVLGRLAPTGSTSL